LKFNENDDPYFSLCSLPRHFVENHLVDRHLVNRQTTIWSTKQFWNWLVKSQMCRPNVCRPNAFRSSAFRSKGAEPSTLQLMFSCFSSRLIPSFSTAQLSLLTWKNKIGCEKKNWTSSPTRQRGVDKNTIQHYFVFSPFPRRNEKKVRVGLGQFRAYLISPTKKWLFCRCRFRQMDVTCVFVFLNGEWAVAILPCTLNSKASFDKKK
jgi:hypothetical protein